MSERNLTPEETEAVERGALHPDTPSSTMPVTDRSRDQEGMRQAIEILTGLPTSHADAGQSVGHKTRQDASGEERASTYQVSVDTGHPGEANPHEFLHIRNSPLRLPAAIENDSRVHFIWNVIEDERINRIGKKKFGRDFPAVQREQMRASAERDPFEDNADVKTAGLSMFMSRMIDVPFESPLHPKLKPLFDRLMPHIDKATSGSAEEAAKVAIRIAYALDLLEKQEQAEPPPPPPPPPVPPEDDDDEDEGEQPGGEGGNPGGENEQPGESEGEPEGEGNEPGKGKGRGKGEPEGKGEGEGQGEAPSNDSPFGDGETGTTSGGEGIVKIHTGPSEGPDDDDDEDDAEAGNSHAPHEYPDDEAVRDDARRRDEEDRDAIEALDEYEMPDADDVEWDGFFEQLADMSSHVEEVVAAQVIEEVTNAQSRTHDVAIEANYLYPEGKADHKVVIDPGKSGLAPLEMGKEMTEVMAELPTKSRLKEFERSGMLMAGEAWRAVATGNMRLFDQREWTGSRLVVLVDNSSSMGHYGDHDDPARYRDAMTIAWDAAAAFTQRYPQAEVFAFSSSDRSEGTTIQPIPNGYRPARSTSSNADCSALLWLKHHLGGDLVNTVVVLISDGFPNSHCTNCAPISHTKQVAQEMYDEGIRYVSVLVHYDNPSNKRDRADLLQRAGETLSTFGSLYPADVAVHVNGPDDFPAMAEAFKALDQRF